MADRRLHVVDLGVVPYGAALDRQRRVAQAVIDGRIDGDVLLLLEHPPVVTLGRSSKQASLVASPAFLASRGVELFEVERGGDVTFHGPGQLVGYPIVDLKATPHKKDLHWYLRQVEEALIQTLAAWNLRGLRNTGYTGVWVGDRATDDAPRTQLVDVTRDAAHSHVSAAAGDSTRSPSDDETASNNLRPAEALAKADASRDTPRRKIASIGVHARDWVTWHGFALNVTTDLSYFDLMIPCGIAGVTMTSMEREVSAERACSVASVAKRVGQAFGEVFGVTPAELPAGALAELTSVTVT
ncbi:MAG: lipoyl(octanoyl) transferase LipB [Gemmatimonadaceae bacterium]